eukprot:s1885_g13.t2
MGGDGCPRNFRGLEVHSYVLGEPAEQQQQQRQRQQQQQQQQRQQQHEQQQQRTMHVSPKLEEAPPRRVPTPRHSPGAFHQRLLEASQSRTPSTTRRRPRPPPAELSELRKLLQEHRQLELAEAAEQRPRSRRAPRAGRPSSLPPVSGEGEPELQQQMQQLLEMQKVQLQMLAAVAKLQAPAAAPPEQATDRSQISSEASGVEEQLRELRRTQELQSEMLEELWQQRRDGAEQRSLPPGQAEVAASETKQPRPADAPPTTEAQLSMPSEIADSTSGMASNLLFPPWQQMEQQLRQLQIRPGGARDAHQVYHELLQLQRLRLQLDCLEVPQDPPVPPPAQHAADEAHDGPCPETLVKAVNGVPPKPAAEPQRNQFHPLPDRPMQLTIDSPSQGVSYEHLDLAQSPRHPSVRSETMEAPAAAVDTAQAPSPPPPTDLARASVPTVMRRPCPPPPPPSAPPRFGAATGETTQWSDLQLQLREQLEALRRRQRKQSDVEALEAGNAEEVASKPQPEEILNESRAQFMKRQQED